MLRVYALLTGRRALTASRSTTGRYEDTTYGLCKSGMEVGRGVSEQGREKWRRIRFRKGAESEGEATCISLLGLEALHGASLGLHQTIS